MEADHTQSAQIPDGLWQRIVGAILFVLGMLAYLVKEYPLAISLFTIAWPLLFWGAMLRNFSLLERKIDALARPGREFPGPGSVQPDVVVDTLPPLGAGSRYIVLLLIVIGVAGVALVAIGVIKS